MTDRELLELAAKAAGLAGAEYQDMAGWGEVRYGFSVGMWAPTLGNYWNPLTDDGDAFRLAVKLRMLVDADGSVYAVATATPKGTDVMVHEKHRDDPYAAVRRAIVRAAAEIGKEST